MAFDSPFPSALLGQRLEIGLYDNSGKIANFFGAEEDIRKAIQHAVEDAARETYLVAYQLCPVDTGFMREHLQVIRSEASQTWEIGWDAHEFYAEGKDFYPLYVVFGTRHMPANDPLTPAYLVTKDKYSARITELVQLALARRRLRAARSTK